MGLVLLLAPILEIYLLVQMAQAWGFLLAVGFCLVSACLGGVVLAGVGRRALQAAQRAVAGGQAPETILFDGVLRFFAGVLLIVPGPVSTAVALLVLFPPTRPLLHWAMRSWVLTQLASGRIFFAGSGPPLGDTDGPDESGGPPERDVVEVEAVQIFSTTSPKPPTSED